MRLALILIPLALAGCAEEITPEQQKMLDDQAVAMVERANAIEPPLAEVVPETIAAAEIDRYDLDGAGCSYAPGTSLGVRVVARPADAFMKVGDEVLRFAADPGSSELAAGTRSLYNGRTHSMRLEIAAQSEQTEQAEGEGEAPQMEGTITLRDSWERVVYTGTGIVSCTG